MIFTPYSDEAEVINMIRRFRNEDYALLRMTYTMIDKNNLDANGILRDLLYNYRLVDYDMLDHGGRFGISHDALFVQHGKTDIVKLKFYRKIAPEAIDVFPLKPLNVKWNAEKLTKVISYIFPFHVK